MPSPTRSKGGNAILAALSPEEMERINKLLHVVHVCPWQILYHAATAYTPPLEEISSALPSYIAAASGNGFHGSARLNQSIHRCSWR
jgi:hypothetical protein